MDRGVYKSGDRRAWPYAEKDTWRGPTEPAEKLLTTAATKEHPSVPGVCCPGWGTCDWQDGPKKARAGLMPEWGQQSLSQSIPSLPPSTGDNARESVTCPHYHGQLAQERVPCPGH